MNEWRGGAGIREREKNAMNNWSIKLNLLIRFKRTLIIIILIFWIFNQKFQLGPQPETLINNIINIWSLSTLLFSLSLHYLSVLYLPCTNIIALYLLSLFPALPSLYPLHSISLLPTLELHLYISSPLTLIPSPLYLSVLTLWLLHFSSNYSNHSPINIPLQTSSHFPNLSLTLLLFSSSLSSLIFLPLQSLFYTTSILLFLFTLFSPMCHIKRQQWCKMVRVVFSRLTVIPDHKVDTRAAEHQRACKWLMVAASSCL